MNYMTEVAHIKVWKLFLLLCLGEVSLKDLDQLALLKGCTRYWLKLFLLNCVSSLWVMELLFMGDESR